MIEEQSHLPFRRRGGKRKGSGRKPKGPRPLSPHRPRGTISRNHPVMTTIRLRKGLPSLRRRPVFNALKRAFHAGSDRLGLRLVHFSVQSNHLHLLVEVESADALSRGMKGLLVRIARALNQLWRRKGRVFAE